MFFLLHNQIYITIVCFHIFGVRFIVHQQISGILNIFILASIGIVWYTVTVHCRVERAVEILLKFHFFKTKHTLFHRKTVEISYHNTTVVSENLTKTRHTWEMKLFPAHIEAPYPTLLANACARHNNSCNSHNITHWHNFNTDHCNTTQCEDNVNTSWWVVCTILAQHKELYGQVEQKQTENIKENNN